MLSRIADHYRCEGYAVSVRPTLAGLSGVDRTPDVYAESEEPIVVTVITGRAARAKDIIAARVLARDLCGRPAVVAPSFSVDALRWCSRYDVDAMDADRFAEPLVAAPVEPGSDEQMPDVSAGDASSDAAESATGTDDVCEPGAIYAADAAPFVANVDGRERDMHAARDEPTPPDASATLEGALDDGVLPDSAESADTGADLPMAACHVAGVSDSIGAPSPDAASSDRSPTDAHSFEATPVDTEPPVPESVTGRLPVEPTDVLDAPLPEFAARAAEVPFDDERQAAEPVELPISTEGSEPGLDMAPEGVTIDADPASAEPAFDATASTMVAVDLDDEEPVAVMAEPVLGAGIGAEEPAASEGAPDFPDDHTPGTGEWSVYRDLMAEQGHEAAVETEGPGEAFDTPVERRTPAAPVSVPDAGPTGEDDGDDGHAVNPQEADAARASPVALLAGASMADPWPALAATFPVHAAHGALDHDVVVDRDAFVRTLDTETDAARDGPTADPAEEIIALAAPEGIPFEDVIALAAPAGLPVDPADPDMPRVAPAGAAETTWEIPAFLSVPIRYRKGACMPSYVIAPEFAPFPTNWGPRPPRVDAGFVDLPAFLAEPARWPKGAIRHAAPALPDDAVLPSFLLESLAAPEAELPAIHGQIEVAARVAHVVKKMVDTRPVIPRDAEAGEVAPEEAAPMVVDVGVVEAATARLDAVTPFASEPMVTAEPIVAAEPEAMAAGEPEAMSEIMSDAIPVDAVLAAPEAAEAPAASRPTPAPVPALPWELPTKGAVPEPPRAPLPGTGNVLPWTRPERPDDYAMTVHEPAIWAQRARLARMREATWASTSGMLGLSGTVRPTHPSEVVDDPMARGPSAWLAALRAAGTARRTHEPDLAMRN